MRLDCTVSRCNRLPITRHPLTRRAKGYRPNLSRPLSALPSNSAPSPMPKYDPTLYYRPVCSLIASYNLPRFLLASLKGSFSVHLTQKAAAQANTTRATTTMKRKTKRRVSLIPRPSRHLPLPPRQRQGGAGAIALDTPKRVRDRRLCRASTAPNAKTPLHPRYQSPLLLSTMRFGES